MIDIRCCDNLELMNQISDSTIDLIYCDILYGTGKKFKDYQDLKPKREIIETHYLPRIKEMHRILKDAGSIYLQMDTRINHWVRCIMDDVFGYDNFINEIVWGYKSGGRGKNSFAKKHDTIYFYSKTDRKKFNVQYEKSYQKYKYGFGKKHGYELLFDNTIKQYYRMTICRDFWQDIDDLGTMGKPYDKLIGYNTQKPKALIERIIKASSNEGDLVADFYAGSFTTAEVCKDLNRNFIGCDINPRAVEIGKKRCV